MVTREPDRSGPLVDALGDAGATTIPIPAIRTALPADGGRALAEALTAAHAYDWLLLTSAAAVRAVESSPVEVPGGAGLRVGVVGAATAAAARAAGLVVAATAPADDSSAAGLARVLLANGIEPCRALLLASDGARPDLPDALGTAGWAVDVVEAYRTVRLPVDDEAAERASGADAIVFYSPSAVDAWEGRELPPVVVTIGPTTSAAVIGRGSTVSAEAAERSVDGVLAALAAAFSG